MAKELRLTVPPHEAVAVIRKALPSDAIVREHDDGIGRFAGDRLVMFVGRDAEHVSIIEGSWRAVKARADKPTLKVTFGEREGGCTATIELVPEPPPSIASRAFEVLGQIALIAAAMVLYYRWQGSPLDTTRIAIIAVAGGIGWSVVAHFLPKKKKQGLDEFVEQALASVRKKKKKKKKKAAEPEAEEPEAEEPEAAEAAEPDQPAAPRG